MTPPHLHRDALSALLDRYVEQERTTRSRVATAAGVTPGHLHDLITGRRSGIDHDLRSRVALAIHVPAEAITCHCSDLARHRPEGPTTEAA